MNVTASLAIAFVGGGGLVAIINWIRTRKLTTATEKQTAAKTDNIAVTTLKEALSSLNEDVIKPIHEENRVIKTELKKLTNELIKFRKAIEKIPSCTHAAVCPVSRELQNDKVDN